MQAPHMIDTDLVRTFLAIHETGSFSAAAKRVLRTPSAVSMQMKRLEEQLGRVLFERLPREVRLTGDGETFLTYAEEIMRVSEAALARFTQPALAGVVRFGAHEDFGIHRLPTILARFAASHPNVDVRVTLKESKVLRERFEAGELDVALHTVCAFDGGAGQLIHEEPLVWAGKRGGRAWQREPLPMALAEDGCAWRKSALKSLARLGREGRIAYVSENGKAMLAAMEADLAITPLPVSALGPDHERLGKRHGLEDLGSYQLRLMQREDAGCAAEALAEHVVESFGPRMATAPVAAE
ncbi:LysR family transcriptional regulator [Vannielia litorea]|nr:LysR family transcriptional regulator [Vannielia litorea]